MSKTEKVDNEVYANQNYLNFIKKNHKILYISFNIAHNNLAIQHLNVGVDNMIHNILVRNVKYTNVRIPNNVIITTLKDSYYTTMLPKTKDLFVKYIVNKNLVRSNMDL